MFIQALRCLDQPEPLVFSHLQLIEQPERLAQVANTPYWVRLESPGENTQVEKALLGLGQHSALKHMGAFAFTAKQLESMDLQHGQIVSPRQYHMGFVDYLEQLQGVFQQKDQWRILSPIDSVVELFDKRRTSARYRQMNIPTAEPLDNIESVGQLRAEMQRRQWKAAFIKVSCASSASCLAVYYPWVGAHGVLMTTIRRTPGGWFNCLHVQRISQPEAIVQAVNFLLQQGSQIERAVPKAKLDGSYFDLRLLVVAGRAAFTVVRQNRHPITNLHLGGWRGRLQHFLEIVDDRALAQAQSDCQEIARAHGCFQLGVDLLFEPDLKSYRIIEANAFGDLLPGLTKDGLTVYEWQIQKASECNPFDCMA